MGGTGKGGSKGKPAAQGKSLSPPPVEQRSSSPRSPRSPRPWQSRESPRDLAATGGLGVEHRVMGGTGEGGSNGKPAAQGKPPSPPPVEQRSSSPPPRRISNDSSDPSTPDAVAPENVTVRAKICYIFLAFFAFWFGAARFDMDGDGDFDAADVQAIMNGGKKLLKLNFSRPVTSKRAKKARRKRIEAKRRQREAKEEEADRTHQEIVRMSREAGGVTGTVANVLEHGAHSVRSLAAKGDAILDADVEEEAQEDEIIDNLRQFWPWFTIIEVLMCLGFWGVNAFNTSAYSLLQSDTVITDDLKLTEYVKKDPNEQLFLDNCKNECSAADEACVGIGWKSGPWPECFLLSSLPTTDPAYPPCQKDAWGWRMYAKQAWTPSIMFFMKGGVESIWPGFTTLDAYNFCHEGYDISFL
ncbi:unnamed protein product [Prorocentrum cordatum]|uniref:Uncharacterized protein n=1 Tax=Prorocentrum cordatum TaxID=2364126 RepID=A0ABN9SBF2_9DINO|nr:unnamed protein product [Polarella glacialis]